MGLVGEIRANRQVSEALTVYKTDLDKTLALAVQIQQIPAPTFEEAKRAAEIEHQFARLGLADVAQDGIHNVYGRIPGRSQAPPVIVSAHSDTVFPAGTDLTVSTEQGSQSQNGLIFGPGLADNAVGVAGLIIIAESIKRFKLKTSRDIWLVANVCEEGLGDLRGMRQVVNRFGQATAYIVIEGGSFGQIFHRAIPVRRYRLEVETPGGHSWGDFGQPNAIHILSQIVASTAGLALPKKPKTTVNIGTIEGGTSVNTIASSASCSLDIRSMDDRSLTEVEGQVKQIVGKLQAEHDIATIKMIQIGNRPGGAIGEESPLVHQAAEALKAVGCKRVYFQAGSTDANIPLSLGLPAVCIGLATSGNTHRQDEFLDPTYLPAGLGQMLLLSLAAAGFEPD